jgi:hypothetical protein
MYRMRTLATLGLLLLVHSATRAQESARLPTEPPPAHWNEAHTTDPVLAPTPPPWHADGPDHFFGVQFLLGTETGVRLQFTFEQTCNRSWAAEIFLGGAATNFGDSGVIGGGVRVNYILNSGAWHDYLILSPGLDLMLLDEGPHIDQPYQSVLFLEPSVDLLWLHDFSPRFGWELGLHAGLGIGLTGRDENDRPAGGKITPVLSVFTGLRF